MQLLLRIQVSGYCNRLPFWLDKSSVLCEYAEKPPVPLIRTDCIKYGLSQEYNLSRILAKAPGPEETNEKTPKITFFQRSTVDAKKKCYPLLVDLFLCVDRRPLKKCAFDPIFVSLFGARCLCQNSHLRARVDRCRPCAGSNRLGSKFLKGKPTQRRVTGWPAARCNLHRVEWGEIVRF